MILFCKKCNSLKDEFERQSGVCAICKSKSKLNIDHDHITGKVRGLLCTGCNIVLGYAKDSSEILNSAASYLSAAQIKINEELERSKSIYDFYITNRLDE